MRDYPRVLCVFGTRPEAIKMAPVVRALAARSSGLVPVVCVTDQHQEMLDQALEFFDVRPDHRLGVMRKNQTPSEVAARVLDRLPAVLEEVRPSAVLVQGDTTTTVAAALAAFHARVPVGHVEAGLRTRRLDSPFPEEANRQLTTVIARWHFAATPRARDNLLREHVPASHVVVTGNPVVDALLWTVKRLGDRRVGPPLRVDAGRRLILVTAHRRESFGAPFVELCTALRELVDRNTDVDLAYPVHLNPQVQAPMRRVLDGHPRIHLLPPVNYCELVDLLRRCHLVLTDSGGMQEEAPCLGKPVLVLRDATERLEGITAGTARLVGTSRWRIVREVERLLRDPAAYGMMARAHNPYGDGRASERIARVLRRALVEGKTAPAATSGGSVGALREVAPEMSRTDTIRRAGASPIPSGANTSRISPACAASPPRRLCRSGVPVSRCNSSACTVCSRSGLAASRGWTSASCRSTRQCRSRVRGASSTGDQ